MQTKKCPNKTEEALIESENRYRELAQSIKESLLVFNKDWIITYANDYSTETVGLTPKDIIGKNVWEMFPNLKGTVFSENYEYVMKNAKAEPSKRLAPTIKNGWRLEYFLVERVLLS